MRWTLKASSILCVWCRFAVAGGGPATDAYDDIGTADAVEVHGLADVYAIHNFNEPGSGENQLRAFDFRDRASLGYLRITLAHRPRRIGFRLDAGAGNTADVYFRQDPAAVGRPKLARSLSFVEQAFVTVMLPTKREVELDVGRFSTPVGFEDNESITNWNYSRSLLYSWAEPSLHTGLRSSCRLTASWAISLFWVNGWNSVVVDGSDMRTFAGAGSWKPTDQTKVVLVYMAGLEHPPTDLAGPLSFRNLLDAYLLYAPIEQASFAVTADYGHDRANGGVNWWGASWYVRLQARSRIAAALRGEYLSDPDGFITGTPQALAGLTTTAELRGDAWRLRIIGRLEYRHDQSSARVFDGVVAASRSHQDTITAALLTAF